MYVFFLARRDLKFYAKYLLILSFFSMVEKRKDSYIQG